MNEALTMLGCSAAMVLMIYVGTIVLSKEYGHDVSDLLDPRKAIPGNILATIVFWGFLTIPMPYLVLWTLSTTALVYRIISSIEPEVHQ